MHWAKDKLGNLLNAEDRRLFRYGLVCPTCGERVRLRAGASYRAHFAHYSHSPRPDCENYHPSSREGARPDLVFHNRENDLKGQASVLGGIYLERGVGGRFSLFLKLPRVDAAFHGSGSLRIKSGLGERLFTRNELQRPNFVRVLPRVPLVIVECDEDMWGVANAIESDAASFRSSWNVFTAGTDSGRLLGVEESVELGESYWVLTKEHLYAPPSELDISSAINLGGGGWLLYKISLSLELRALPLITIRRLSDYIHREIRSPKARSHIVFPIPHHFDIDGTLIYPASISRLELRRTAGARLELKQTANRGNLVVEEFDAESVSIVGALDGEVGVICDSELQFNIRVESAPLFQPIGIQVSVGEEIFELFDSGLRDALIQNNGQAVMIDAPTYRVADKVSVDAAVWDRRDTRYVLKVAENFESIRAGNFGELIRRAQQPVVVDAPARDDLEEGDPLRNWIEGVFGRAAGHFAIAQLREYWNGTSPRFPDACYLGLAWLRPYVENVRKMRGN